LAPASGEEASAHAQVHRLPGAVADGAAQTRRDAQEEGAEVGAGMRAVAPPVQSFAAGRRR
jgi:hypothetical protein